MKLKRSTIFLGLMLTGTLAAAALVSGENTAQMEVAEAVVSRQDNAAALKTGQPSLHLERLARNGVDAPIRDLFARKTWYVPPPPPRPAPVRKPVVVEAPRPVAPPVPFKFIGLMREQDGTVTAYLEERGQMIMAKQGDTLNDSYRVSSISPKQVDLVYLPMDIHQTLAADGSVGVVASSANINSRSLPPAAIMNTTRNYR